MYCYCPYSVMGFAIINPKGSSERLDFSMQAERYLLLISQWCQIPDVFSCAVLPNAMIFYNPAPIQVVSSRVVGDQLLFEPQACLRYMMLGYWNSTHLANLDPAGSPT